MAFPVELYRPVVGYVRDRDTLRTLLLTSRHMNVEAEWSLYFRFDNVHNVKTQVLFLQRIVDCPRVARIVNSYRFEIDWRTNFDNDHIFWTLLPQALRAMVNLKTLQFRTNGGMPRLGLLDGCTFQLEHCLWHCHSDEIQMQRFLQTQHRLKSLSMGGWNSDRFPAPTNHSEQPDLKELCGSYGVIHAFLPGRDVTYVRWVPDLDDPWDTSTGMDTEGLAASFQKVKFLRLGGYFMRPHLCSISTNFTSLVFLEVMGYDDKEDASVFALPSLKMLRISVRWGLNKVAITNPSERTEELFAGSKSLEFVDIEEEPTYKGNYRIPRYSRWKRGSGSVGVFDVDVEESWPSIC
ncbi:hypothetical protein F5880DRAFT_54578 [Lentinula raphanica]|nr:hypothetical protein F5880DRAFT_54578 [Lentinula raphanica]